MRIEAITWIEAIVDKLAAKHRVSPGEVEDVLSARPRFRYVERGHRPGEHVYAAFGRSRAGRRLVIFFVYKPRSREALVISAREPSAKERKQYEKR